MELYEHQKKIINADPKKTLIALGTGGGKTRVALELARGTTLIVCPKQQKLDATWQENAKKFGIKKQLTVISKEEFRRDHAKLGRFDTVIFDECHTILGATPDTRRIHGKTVPKTSQLFEAARSYLARTNPDRLYLCSATPVTKPIHLWALATLFGHSWNFFDFRDKYYYEKKIGYRSWWIPRNKEDLRQRLADVTKSFGYTGQLSDWFDVPEQTHKTIHVGLTQEQKKAIKEIAAEEADPMVLRGKRRTIENGILYAQRIENVGNKTDILTAKTDYFETEKLEHIEQLCREFDKVLIFAAYTGQIEQIKRHLELQSSIGDEGGKRETYILTGSTKNRGEVIRQANESTSRVVVIAQSSISAGYELPTFPCVIFASKSYRYVDYEQALGRVLRANALKKNLYVHLVVKGGVDEDCHRAIMSGQDFQEKLME